MGSLWIEKDGLLSLNRWELRSKILLQRNLCMSEWQL